MNESAFFVGKKNISEKETISVYEDVKVRILKLIEENNVLTFSTAAIPGFDSVAAKCVLQVKEKMHPQIKLTLVLPYEGYVPECEDWQKKEFELIKSTADSVVYVSDNKNEEALKLLSRYLVEHNRYCICCVPDEQHEEKLTIECNVSENETN